MTINVFGSFVAFFIFVGNLTKIDVISSSLSSVVAGHEFIAGVLASQVISNVPAAVMLSGFTDNGTQLMLGVNIGGLGTLIASLASLISFQFYRKSEGADSILYIAVFSVINFGMLIILLCVLVCLNILSHS